MRVPVRWMRTAARMIKPALLQTASTITGHKYAIFAADMIGIGNRLVGLANLCCWFGFENLRLYWSIDDWVSAPFEDLFKLDCRGFHCRSFSLRRVKMSASFHPFPHKYHGLYWSFYVPVSKGAAKSVDFQYTNTPQWAKNRYGAFFSRLHPSEKVLRRVSAVELPPDYVGVHIRNSLNARDCPSRVATIDSYIKTMQTYPSATMFYLSCHEKNVSAEVQRRFPNRIIELPSKDYHNMVDAVADMWLLGRGTAMICAPGSTFSECAWWWGGAQCDAAEVLNLR